MEEYQIERNKSSWITAITPNTGTGWTADIFLLENRYGFWNPDPGPSVPMDGGTNQDDERSNQEKNRWNDGIPSQKTKRNEKREEKHEPVRPGPCIRNFSAAGGVRRRYG